MKQKLKGINTCKFCGKTYEVGFYGAGYKYCSHSCNRKGRALADKERFKKYNKDLLVIIFDKPVPVSAVYTKSSTPSAPIIWDKKIDKIKY